MTGLAPKAGEHASPVPGLGQNSYGAPFCLPHPNIHAQVPLGVASLCSRYPISELAVVTDPVG